MSEVPQVHSESHTHGSDLLVRRYEAKSAKGKGAWGKVQRKPVTSCQGSSLSGVTEDIPNSLEIIWKNTCGLFSAFIYWMMYIWISHFS